MLLGYLTDTSISCKLRHMMFENERKEIGVDSRGGGRPKHVLKTYRQE